MFHIYFDTKLESNRAHIAFKNEENSYLEMQRLVNLTYMKPIRDGLYFKEILLEVEWIDFIAKSSSIQLMN